MAIDRVEPATSGAEGRKAVMFLSGVLADQVTGYILLTYTAEGKLRIDSTVCCHAHLVSLLADAVAEMTADEADEHAVLLSS